MDWPEGLYRLIEEGVRRDAPAVCVAHRGLHCWYLDGCQALPKQRRPFTEALRRCREDPACRLAEGSHVHAPPTRIEVDVASLAEAIVRASRAARDEYQEARERPPAAPPAPPAERPSPPRRVIE